MTKLTRITRSVALTTVMLLGTGLAHSAVLEEITVTAQKREQNLQDVGISVTAWSGEQMKALGVTNAIEIADQVPSLSMTTFSPNLTVFNIRGVSQNNFTDNLEAPVAVYIDDAYMASMNGINAQLFDIERVEVLRGPQGTLFGRNATGGVIHYLTRGADDEEMNAYIEGGYGEYDRRSLEFAVGGGVGWMRYRIAGRTEEMDGYIESTQFTNDAGEPVTMTSMGDMLGGPTGVDLGGLDGDAVRVELQFDLAETALLTLQHKYTKDDNVPTGGYSFLPYGDASQAYIPPEIQGFAAANIPPAMGLEGAALEQATAALLFCPDQIECFTPVDNSGRTIYEGDHPNPYEHYSDYAGYLDRETDSTTAKLDWELNDSLRLVAISNYFTLDKFYTEDGDGIPARIIEFTTVADFEQFSQEIRLSGETDNLRWVAGGYYLDTTTEANVITRGAPAGGEAASQGHGDAVTPAVLQDYELESSNWSVFGQGEFDFNDSLTLIAGLRWSQDDKELDFKTSLADGSTILVPVLFDLKADVAEQGLDTDEVDYGDWAGRLQLDWRINDATLAYVSYNRGIKGGNFAPSANVRANDIRHDEEKLYAYEIGLKTDFADGLARLNAAVFYYDYEDYQAFTFANGTPSISNAQAENTGAEVELILTPGAHWDIILGAAFQDSEVDDVQTPQQQFLGPLGTQIDWPVDILNGVELPNTPDYSFNYLLRYNVDVMGGNIALQLDGVFYDEHYLEVSNAAGALQGAYAVHNAHIDWRAAEHLRLSVWVKNLRQEEYKNYALDLGVLGATATYGLPRTWGATVAYHF